MIKTMFKIFSVVLTVAATVWVSIPLNAEDMPVAAEAPVEEAAAEASTVPQSEKTSLEEAPAVVKPARQAKRYDRADAFLVGADWDFDGFVAGGQDSKVRSMFYLNDLIYINIGAQHGIGVGDRIGIYKRGERVRDPQTGKFIGYEVRRAAIARASDRVEDDVAAIRIVSTYEPVEIGDLVRREQ